MELILVLISSVVFFVILYNVIKLAVHNAVMDAVRQMSYGKNSDFIRVPVRGAILESVNDIPKDEIKRLIRSAVKEALEEARKAEHKENGEQLET